MADNITKGCCHRLVDGELCPECKKKGVFYIGCEVHACPSEPVVTWEDVDHYYCCESCGKEWSNLIYFV